MQMRLSAAGATVWTVARPRAATTTRERNDPVMYQQAKRNAHDVCALDAAWLNVTSLPFGNGRGCVSPAEFPQHATKLARPGALMV